MIRKWMEVLHTGKLPEHGQADPVSRWLVITRASLLSLSLFAVLIGGLLAALDGAFHPLLWLLAALWLLPAQAVNHLINDLFDNQQGIDTEDYARARRMPHPLIHGLTGRGGLAAATLLLFTLDLGVIFLLTRLRGWPLPVFAAAVFLLNLFCVAPPLKLKQRGLGELAQLVLWGPVMTGGTYFAVAGDLPARVWPLTLPYGMAVTASLLGMYIDRRKMDETRWVLTTPVLLGERRSRTLLQLTVWAYYLLAAGLVSAGRLPWGVLLVLVSLPVAARFLVVLHENDPVEEPKAAPRSEGIFMGRPPSQRKTPSLPPLPGRLTVWGRRWQGLATLTFAAGLLIGVVLNLFKNMI